MTGNVSGHRTRMVLCVCGNPRPAGSACTSVICCQVRADLAYARQVREAGATEATYAEEEESEHG